MMLLYKNARIISVSFVTNQKLF